MCDRPAENWRMATVGSSYLVSLGEDEDGYPAGKFKGRSRPLVAKVICPSKTPTVCKVPLDVSKVVDQPLIMLVDELNGLNDQGQIAAETYPHCMSATTPRLLVSSISVGKEQCVLSCRWRRPGRILGIMGISYALSA